MRKKADNTNRPEKIKEELFLALEAMARENNISVNDLAKKIEEGIAKAVKKEKEYAGCDNINIVISPEQNEYKMCIIKEVVEGEPENPNQINIDEARAISEDAYVGGTVEIKLDAQKFGRVAAQSVKQSVRHDIKEIEKNKLLKEFEGKKDEIFSARVVRIEPDTGNVILMLDKTELCLFKNEQIPGEKFKEGELVKIYIVSVINPDKKPAVKISRTHKNMVKRLFEREIPEVFDGMVEVKAISREAGSRTKIAVCSKDKSVDAIGACIGPQRSRITKIVEELGGEKIDIIPYSEDPKEFIAAALAPAKVIDVTLAEDGNNVCTVIVPDDQLSLAIGIKGQNAKLAARLTEFKIDIHPENEPPAASEAGEE